MSLQASMKVFSTIFLLIIITTCSTYACKCVHADSVRQAFRITAGIFHGKVLSRKLVPFSETVRTEKADSIRTLLKDDKQKHDLFDLDYIYKIEFQVLEGFKATHTGQKVIIYTAMNTASCGYAFELNKEYIIYALEESYMKSVFLSESEGGTDIEKPDTYWTSLCTRTREYQDREASELRKQG